MRQTARSISGNSERPKLGPRTGSTGVGVDSSPRHVSTPYDPPQTQRNGRRSTLMGEKLNDISNMITGNAPQGELPLYKDKPYSHPAATKYTPSKSRSRMLLPIIAALIFIFYVSGGTSRFLKKVDVGNDPEDFLRKHPITTSFNDMLSDPSVPTETWEDRRERVKDAFKISWQAYEDNAWGFDEYHPVSKTSRQMVPNGMGWIIIDALDTMMIMNLTTQLAHAREWLSTTLTYDQNHEVSTFEATIRQLGGLLGAHYLSTTYPNMAPVPPLPNPQKNEDLYLELATDLADRMLGAFSSQSGIPFATFNLQTRTGVVAQADGGSCSTAEAATLQLELKYLADLTGEKNYWEAAERVIKVMDDNGMRDGLVPIFLSGQTGKFQGENIRLGSRGDSYYEYLIKQYLQTKETIYHDMWKQALRGIKKHLITYTRTANLTILGERPNGLDQPVFPKMDHLVCYVPGTIALAATEGKTLAEAKKSKTWGKQQDEDMELAKQLSKTCWGMYLTTATGLSPEIAHFRTHSPPIMMEDVYPKLPKSPETLRMSGDTLWRMDYDIHFADFHNMQRPEFVETLFYMWRITGDVTYREWGWKIFKAFVEYTSAPNNGGFSSVQHVDKLTPPTRDNMESFWMAETLKYLYLLFSPSDLIPLESVVLNTEAHPLPRFDMGKRFHTGWERRPRDKDGNLIVS